MEAQPRQLHQLEKIVALFALFAVLALTFGFAQGAGNKKRVHADEYDRAQAAQPEKVFLRSNSVLVQDAASGETILSKNADAVMPIASITKLMTAMVTLDKGLDLEDRVVISTEDMDQLKGTHSRLRPGAVLTRNELLLLALMASENRAAAALARTYPGGTQAFVAAMNEKALSLGMLNTRFEDSTGLTAANVSTAPDLARMVQAAHEYPVIRQYSTRDQAQVSVFGQWLQYFNTNGLVRGHVWDIGLSKTGFINEAGRCLVMRVRLASKDLVVILLDSWGKNSRIGDAQRIKKWLETSTTRRPQG
ncbi:MAG: D-alanyl-D-alanine endopeptidase [Proteobacteria bacterium]|nr:D-alanyl-D-alanine endopeptidase [Pseudomonadota bacterium]